MDFSRPLFGTFKGVFVPNVVSMIGVIYFLKLGGVVASIGASNLLWMVFATSALVVVTVLSSVSMISKRKMGTGGNYFLISRTLGPSIGGAIGVGLVMCQCVVAVLCFTGFALSVQQFVPHVSLLTLEMASLCLTSLLIYASPSLVSVTQGLIFGVIVVCIALFFSHIHGPYQTLEWTPLRFDDAFWEGFAVLLPVFMSVEAGISLSGQLRNPKKSILHGTLYAIIAAIGLFIFTGLALLVLFPTEILRQDEMVMIQYSSYPFLSLLGLMVAVYSSALAALAAAVEICKAMVKDQLFGERLSRVTPAKRDIAILVALCMMVAVALLFTNLDSIFPLIAMVFLTTYALMNLTSAASGFINPPSLIAGMGFYWPLSLLAAAACLWIMFQIHLWGSVVALAILGVFCVFFHVFSNVEQIQDLRHLFWKHLAVRALYRLDQLQGDILSWTPHVVAIPSMPLVDTSFLRFCEDLTERNGLLSYVAFVPEDWSHAYRKQSLEQVLDNKLAKRHGRHLRELVFAADRNQGFKRMAMAQGFSSLSTNTFIFPFQAFEVEDSWFSILRDSRKNVIVTSFNTPPSAVAVAELVPRVDIWWHSGRHSSFELSLSYVQNLIASKRMRHLRVRVCALVEEVHIMQQVSAYLEGYLEQLGFIDEILVEVEVEANQTVETISRDSTLVVFPLLADITIAQLMQQYTDTCNVLANVIMVGDFDTLDHREIYNGCG
ncbi:MAG: hypothetical protein OXT67_10660 [Zetaproteobacteria bacterium]|nr:hypothetical protein [Zetaproteobacteria bacterium]